MCFERSVFPEYGLYTFCLACMAFATCVAVKVAIALLVMDVAVKIARALLVMAKNENTKNEKYSGIAVLTRFDFCVSNMACICAV